MDGAFDEGAAQIVAGEDLASRFNISNSKIVQTLKMADVKKGQRLAPTIHSLDNLIISNPICLASHLQL
jgi:hypothetical protein